jgi:hypothetical protein
VGKKGQGRTGIRKKERKGNFKCASGDVKVKGKRQDKTLTMRKRKKAVKMISGISLSHTHAHTYKQ